MILRDFLLMFRALAIYVALGALVSFIFYYLKYKELFGGFIGGMVVGVIGALIGGFLLDKLLYDITVRILEFLSRDVGVNVITGFVGGYCAVYIMNRLNHDKDRKKY